jgi:manganese transport protein
VPALVTVILYGERASGGLLVLSQVILSLQLPFAVFPLVVFVGDKRRMGRFAIGPGLKAASWAVAIAIALLNVWLLVQMIAGLF